jgi:membrane-bound acyltransferase YfiQ involved in biofilm formation
MIVNDLPISIIFCVDINKSGSEKQSNINSKQLDDLYVDFILYACYYTYTTALAAQPSAETCALSLRLAALI